MATIDFTNSVFDGLSFADPALSGPITIADSGTVSNKSGGTGGSPNEDGLELWGGAYTVSILGTVATTSTLDAETAGLYVGKGEGASKITVGPAGTVSGKNWAVNTLQAINLTNNGTIAGGQAIKIDSGIDSSTITNSGTIAALGGFNAVEYVGGGTLNVTNKSLIIGDIIGTDGAMVISNTGFINGIINLYENADKLTNKGVVTGNIFLDKGNDTFINSGTIEGSVFMDDGNDIFTNTGKLIDPVSGLENVVVSMGAGDDKFTGGAAKDYVFDDDGMDTYKMADGVDQFFAVKTTGATADTKVDTVDGGGHKGAIPLADVFGDIYDAAISNLGVVVNLDSAAFTVELSTYDAAKATGTEIGIDLIKGFESAFGGGGADILNGNSLANGLYGAGGSDLLFGGKGNDSLDGGAGGDTLVGGLGRDQLTGGIQDDRFTYKSVAESTLARAGRDLIMDFEDTVDIIDLSALGLAASVWAGTDAAFSGVAGEYRVLTTGFGWTFQLDTNADKKADMAIDILQLGLSVTWSDLDFAF